MAAARREPPASFMYEPDFPPTIPPGLTVSDWRRRRRRHGSRRGLIRRGADECSSQAVTPGRGGVGEPPRLCE